jgi:hypothetical protein
MKISLEFLRSIDNIDIRDGVVGKARRRIEKEMSVITWHRRSVILFHAGMARSCKKRAH